MSADVRVVCPKCGRSGAGPSADLGADWRVVCPDCGGEIRSAPTSRPVGGRVGPGSALLIPTVAALGVILLLGSLHRMGQPSGDADPDAAKIAGMVAASRAALSARVDAMLVRYRIERGSRPRDYDQVRVIVRPGRHRLGDYYELADRIRKAEGSRQTHLLFFDHMRCLDNPEGAGLLAEADWPHWLLEVGISADGRRVHDLATDRRSGQPRRDVLP